MPNFSRLLAAGGTVAAAVVVVSRSEAGGPGWRHAEGQTLRREWALSLGLADLGCCRLGFPRPVFAVRAALHRHWSHCFEKSGRFAWQVWPG